MASCYASKIAKKPENIGLLRLLRLKTPLPEEDLCPQSSPSPLLAAQLRHAEGGSARLHVSLSPRLLRRLRVSASFEMPSLRARCHWRYGSTAPVRLTVRVKPQESPMFMRLGTAVRVPTPPAPSPLVVPIRGSRLGAKFRTNPNQSEAFQAKPKQSEPTFFFVSSFPASTPIYSYLHLAPNRTWFEPQIALPFHLRSLTFT